MAWRQLSLHVAAQHAECIEKALEELGALSVARMDAGDEPWFERVPSEDSPWQTLELCALFPGDLDTQSITNALEKLPGVPVASDLQFDTLEDRDWVREWMRDFRPMQFGRLSVCPTHSLPPNTVSPNTVFPKPVSPDAEAVNLILDPGQAFGSGTHASTALCLQWLGTRSTPLPSLLDYGCGSGILAIAALLLGAERAWACDIDPTALEVTAENAARNAVRERLWIGEPQALPAIRAQLVVANILAQPLSQLPETLARLQMHTGTLLLAGILEEQAEDLIRCYAPYYAIDVVARRGPWVLLQGERRPPNA